ncbi:MAG TPA: hypothetical protein VMX17_00620 [Candidatus Glassbacteria bacterium]|nr:hypothetical protein [Candidatus Glassbacteria bacterium]
MNIKKLLNKYGYVQLTLDYVERGVVHYFGEENGIEISISLDFSKKIKQFKELSFASEIEVEYLMTDYEGYKVKTDVTIVKTKTKKNIK